MTLRFLQFFLPLLCRTSGLHLILAVGLWICSYQLLEEVILVFLMMAMGGSGHRTLCRQDKLFVNGFVPGLVFQSLHLRTFLVPEVGQFRLHVPRYKQSLLGLLSTEFSFHYVSTLFPICPSIPIISPSISHRTQSPPVPNRPTKSILFPLPRESLAFPLKSSFLLILHAFLESCALRGKSHSFLRGCQLPLLHKHRAIKRSSNIIKLPVYWCISSTLLVV